ncbi:interferon-inducible double-stranded RNA-dependent protein kinase activator A homolog isoform X4 [Drosophila subpulchrella]|uniref:interferon-inducible double-stranded RNA-dependent protein kinase activator A homolog isoform X4 n=1 Tax=Drosophila subpulchrella TaxID=1486046 RepID=UPI0018A1B29F|nr:interferon-inducible double-stranded RNA-dependent protein kinase activator A homolog isoform X4 [Drosophila subpulchrella]
MDQENFQGHSLPQQLQNLHIQQQQQQAPPNPVQTGFAPRRQYENPGGLGNGNPAGGSPVKGAPLGQRPVKIKKEKIAQVIQPGQLQLTEVGDPALAGGSGAAGLMGGIMPSDEALKFVSETDANGLAMKTPVSILQELLSRRGITPGYELVQIEGAIHEPTFRFRVSFKDKDTPFTAMGAGRSKKEAKHAAARALIDKLIGAQLPESPSSSAGPSVTGLTVAGSGGDGNANATGGGDGGDKIVGNPIGWLQEMCMQRRWPPPSYETETEVGLPHERLFTIACSILNYREMGKGKSKKIAKRLAAHRMWMRLQDAPIDSAKISDSICGELEGETCLKSTKIDYIKLLGEIATENQFEVTYVDIEEKTFSGQFQCLVQLSTLPVGVCHGSGATAADAQRHAAQNALEYLKIMTKK